MGIIASWYNSSETFMESSISYSHRKRVLIVKETKEVENTKASSKYRDEAEG